MANQGGTANTNALEQPAQGRFFNERMKEYANQRGR